MKCTGYLEALIALAGASTLVGALPSGQWPPAADDAADAAELADSASSGYLRMEAEVFRGHTFQDSKRGARPHMLEKRAEDGSVLMELQNNQTFYKVDLEVGSDKQTVGVLVDTGSSDLWLMNKNNTYCSSSSSSSSGKGRRLSDLRNLNEEVAPEKAKREEIYETQTVTAGSSGGGGDLFSNFGGMYSWTMETGSETGGYGTETASGSSASETAVDCSEYGTFDPSSSDSFKSNETAFSISYADDSFAKGTWGTDDVTFNGVTVKQLSMAVADETNSSMGVLGIGLKGLETTYSGESQNPYTYENLPFKMQSQGLINRAVYSVYLNNSEASTASVLFGAVDHSKYTGTLSVLPIINTAASLGYSSPVRLEVTLSRIYLGSSKSKTAVRIASGAAAALLDTGTTLTYAPSDIVSAVVDKYNFQYSNSVGTYVAKCSEFEDAEMVFDFQGAKIWVPLSSFAISLTTNGGSSSSYCALGLIENETGDDSFTLGESFLNNVYFVADLEELQIAIAPANFDSNSEDIDVVSGSGIPSAKSAAAYSSSWGASGSADATALSVKTGAETVTSTAAGADSTGTSGSNQNKSSSSSSSGKSTTASSGSSSKSGSSSAYGAGNGWGVSVLGLVFAFGVSVLIIG